MPSAHVGIRFDVKSEQIGDLMWRMLGVEAAIGLSRWARLLIWFGLRRETRRAYRHTFSPSTDSHHVTVYDTGRRPPRAVSRRRIR